LCRPDLGITTPGVLQRVEAWLLNSLRADHDYGK
jgi:hypothetical protein